MLIASIFLLWIAVALLTVAVIALSRQIAALRAQAAPMEKRAPRVGDLAPVIAAPSLSGDVVTVGGRAVDGRPSLLLFVAADCAISGKIIPVATVIARAGGLRLILVGDGDGEDFGAMLRRLRLDNVDFALSTQIGPAYQVGRLPWAVLIGVEGNIAARGPVKSREHLESLLVADGSPYRPGQIQSLRSGAENGGIIAKKRRARQADASVVTDTSNAP